MKKALTVLSIMLLCAGAVLAQKTEKPWTEWNLKEATKVLTDSAWAQTQTELAEAGVGQTSAVTRTNSTREATSIISSEAARGMESGETVGKKNTAASLNYRVAFLSAKPIRQAFIRLLELQRPDTPAEKVAELRTFVDRSFGDYIVVTLIADGTDKKRLVPVMQEISTAESENLKTTTYLERKDGKRAMLMDYRPPAPDGLGAKLVFARTVDGKPFLDPGAGEVRVVVEMGKTIKVIRRFKVNDMMYAGNLEY